MFSNLLLKLLVTNTGFKWVSTNILQFETSQQIVDVKRGFHEVLFVKLSSFTYKSLFLSFNVSPLKIEKLTDAKLNRKRSIEVQNCKGT